MTPKDYLEHALRPTKGSDPGVVAKNRIRQSITTLFPDRECFCLVRPVSNEKQLQNLDALPPAQLRPEFREVGPVQHDAVNEGLARSLCCFKLESASGSQSALMF